MIGWRTVRATRMHARKLVCNDTLNHQATLFPFFNHTGRVDHVLIVDAHSAELRAYRTEATRTSIPLWGPICVNGPITPLDEHAVEQLAPLWHFDPWWLLKDSRFSSLESVPTLKQTNCANSFDDQAVDVEFNVSLTVVQRIRFSVPAQETQSRRFVADMLPRREDPSSTGAPTMRPHSNGWILDPVWKT